MGGEVGFFMEVEGERGLSCVWGGGGESEVRARGRGGGREVLKGHREGGIKKGPMGGGVFSRISGWSGAETGRSISAVCFVSHSSRAPLGCCSLGPEWRNLFSFSF